MEIMEDLEVIEEQSMDVIQELADLERERDKEPTRSQKMVIIMDLYEVAPSLFLVPIRLRCPSVMCTRALTTSFFINQVSLVQFSICQLRQILQVLYYCVLLSISVHCSVLLCIGLYYCILFVLMCLVRITMYCSVILCIALYSSVLLFIASGKLAVNWSVVSLAQS